jgi:putative transposase
MNRYRNESARLRGWDYSSDGYYFITTCTKPRRDFFGHILQGRMILSIMGLIAEECWRAVPDHYANAELGAYVIMPDHFHGILVIRSGYMAFGRVGTGVEPVGTGRIPVGTGHAPSLPANRQTVGNIVGSFKSAVTKKIRETGIGYFGWQERFYDRIIRNENELSRIEQYIHKNPQKWKPSKMK